MSLGADFRPRARDDVAEAYDWYEERRKGLGEAFLLEVHRGVRSILLAPSGFQRVHRDFRQAPLSRFPYLLVYVLSKDRIVVMRVFHTSRHPTRKFRGRRK